MTEILIGPLKNVQTSVGPIFDCPREHAAFHKVVMRSSRGKSTGLPPPQLENSKHFIPD